MAAKSRRGRMTPGTEITVFGPATITILTLGEFVAVNHREDDPPPRVKRNPVDDVTSACNNDPPVAAR